MSVQTNAREEILGAAARILARRGFQGMSMRDLSRATKRGIATLYHHFESKEEVLSAVHSAGFASLLSAAQRAIESVATGTPSERLHAFILAHVQFVVDQPDVMRVLVHEASGLPENDRRELRMLKARYYDLGRGLVREMMTRGCGASIARGTDETADVEIERSTYALFGMLNWTWAWYDPIAHGSPGQVARTFHRMLMCGLVSECGIRTLHEETAERARHPFVRLPHGGGMRP